MYRRAIQFFFFRNVLNNLHVFLRLLLGNYFTLSPGSLQLSLALAKSILIFSTLFFYHQSNHIKQQQYNDELATKIYEWLNSNCRHNPYL